MKSTEEQLRILRAFAREALEEFWQGDGEMQDLGIKHGLLKMQQVTEFCAADCSCRDVVDPDEGRWECCRFAEILGGKARLVQMEGGDLEQFRKTGTVPLSEDRELDLDFKTMDYEDVTAYLLEHGIDSASVFSSVRDAIDRAQQNESPKGAS